MGHCSSMPRPTHEPIPTNPTDPAPPKEESLSQHTLTPASSARSSVDLTGGKTLEYERQAQQTSTDIMDLFAIFGLLPPFKGNEKSIFSSKNERDLATMQSLRDELTQIFVNHAAVYVVRPEEMMYSNAPTAELWLPPRDTQDENTRRESWRKTDSDMIPPSPMLRTYDLASEGRALGSMLSPLEEGRASLSLSEPVRDSERFPAPLIIHMNHPHSSMKASSQASNTTPMPSTPPSPTSPLLPTSARLASTPTIAAANGTPILPATTTTSSSCPPLTSTSSFSLNRSPIVTPKSFLFGTTPVKSSTTNFTSSSSSVGFKTPNPNNYNNNNVSEKTPPKENQDSSTTTTTNSTDRDSFVNFHTPTLRSSAAHDSGEGTHGVNILPPLHGPISSPVRRSASIGSVGYHAIDASLRLALSPMGPIVRLMTAPNTPDDRDGNSNLPRPWAELSSDHLFFQLDLHKLHSWEFDPLSYDHPTARAFAAKIFVELGAARRFSITPSKMFAFLERVDNSYHQNRYHNFKHGLDVLHCNYMLLWTTRLISMGSVGLRSVDVLGFLVAGLCHDIGHPGTNNALEVNTRSNLALLYNDQSVLEHMHCAVTFKLLAQPECNIAENLTPTENTEFRKVVIGCILATDMTHHFAMVARLSPLFSRLERQQQQQMPEIGRNLDSVHGSDAPPISTVFRPADVKELLNALIHFSDISNVTKPWEISKAWSDRVTDEFFAQGDLERKLGLPVSPFMDRNTGNQPQVTINFVDYVVGPLLLPIVRFFTNLVTLASHMVENRERWEKTMMSDIEERFAQSVQGEQEKAEKDAQLAILAERTRKFKSEFIEQLTHLSTLNRKQSLARRASWNYNFKTGTKSEASTVPSTPRAITTTLSQGDVSVK